jgi:putative FmdB family regulatory protein
MPVYEYVCLDCGTRFDALRPMRAADSPLACGQCESEHTSRTLSVFYAQSGGRTVAGTNGGGCGSCSGGSCAACSSN